MATRKRSTRRLGAAAVAVMAAAATATLAARRSLEAEKLQLRRLELEELTSRRRALAHQQRMHWELLSRAIDDPSLAAVIDTYAPDTPAAKRRQYFYANAWYVNLYHLYRVGLIDLEEFHGHARELMHNPLMREYWEASKALRATLADSSDEAELGRIVDQLVTDLDEADTDEWWVVGDPPTIPRDDS
ncbi:MULTISPECIES: DUF6082 family protein [Streptomyces]|uniref:DUF6082 family protein n=2 Tax=Streptomyces TaxID=1883 RepID=UPI000D525CD6|nr:MULTISPECIES: DUF6082 family protein [Streptomyces]AWE52862.1 hypothetical protein DC008_26335 [Streptomyces nigra]MCF2535648.1 DUF6082 family protein [Streptomyces sp. FB2]